MQEYLAAPQIDAQCADREPELLVLGGSTLGVPPCDSQPRQELAHREGLEDVVVCSGVQDCDSVADLISRGKRDDRLSRKFTKLFGDVDAVGVWQVEVEQDDVWVPRARVGNARLARGGF